MRKKIVCGLIPIGVVAIAIGCVLALTKNSEPAIQWSPVDVSATTWWGAFKNDVALNYWSENGKSYINITISLPDPSHNVTDWGTPTINGNNIEVSAEVWKRTGGAITVLVTFHHTYDLGVLQHGDYTFTFKVWDTLVKTITFTVP